MAIIKCKMCGGDLLITPGLAICECEHCGTKQTVPTTDNEKILLQFARADRRFQAKEFDKAAGIYESIVADLPEESEAYWGLVLCQYGIEYVDDPATGRKIPTCHRVSYNSVLEDPNYEQAYENADPMARRQYRQEALELETIRQRIIEVSSREAPYDIFICYKETAEDGNRTIDSVIAQDVYDALTERGYRVFFSRVSLETNLGKEYEPFIFAALNSAKIMLVFGTDYEYFNAVWVKNEWSRFLKLMEKDKSKALISCYKNLNPARDLPREFQSLQAQDMGKVGAMQDLLRGIEKILPRKKPEPAPAAAAAGANTAGLLERAFLFLEDGNWKEADACCEKALDQDPKIARAYLGKLMAELQVRRQDDLMRCREPFLDRDNCKKAMRFGDAELTSALRRYNDYIVTSNKDAIYAGASQKMKSAAAEAAFREAAALFKKIPGWKDADQQAAKCLEEAEIARKNAVYADAAKKMKIAATEKTFREAADLFRKIPGWKDADAQLEICRSRIQELQAKEEAERREQERREEARQQEKKRREEAALLERERKEEALRQERERQEQERRLVARRAARRRTIVTIVTLTVVVCLISGFFLYTRVIQPNSLFASQKSGLSDVSVGDTIKFGAFEQDNKSSNGKEEIEWLVLQVDGDKALVISKYVLTGSLYARMSENNTWEKSTIRSWLNGAFCRKAFGPDHKARILGTEMYGSNGSFTDHVFLLHTWEVNLLGSDAAKRCAATAYAAAHRTYESSQYLTEEGEYSCQWWLMDSGTSGRTAAFVSYSGAVDTGGSGVTSQGYGVRPAMWIKIG